jgi:hypothetical protein
MTQPATVRAPFSPREHARFTPPPPFPIDAASRLSPPPVPGETRKPKLLDQVREAMRTRHYSLRAEKTHMHWIKRFIFFHAKRHPQRLRTQNGLTQ